VIRVVILFGGVSAEHEVSILSARNIWQALDRKRFTPVLIAINKQGRWQREPEATLANATGDPRRLRLDAAAPAVTFEQAIGPEDVVFPVLHGTYGEDGTVQGLLDLADVGYVGAGVLGSAIGMDKDVSKRLLRHAGIPVVDHRIVTAVAFAEQPSLARALGAELGFPLFVKPANAGSSVGVNRVSAPAELDGAIRAALALDSKVLLERGINAREIECAVLGNEKPQASLPGEIVVNRRHDFYSYEAKYVDPDGAAWRTPADLPASLTARVQELAVATFRTLELSGMARVDFFLDRGSGDLYVNEVNTIPGFTAISMYPKMWEASGVPASELVSRLLELAIERRDTRRRIAATLNRIN
jgi:D-alanine-D-alanine ligase